MAESEYESLVKLVEEIEKEYKHQELSFVDATGTFGKSASLSAKSYADAVALIELVEYGRKPKEPAAKKEPAAVEPHLITAGVVQSQYAQPKMEVPRQKKPQISKELMQKQREAVGKELSNIAGAFGSIIPTINEIKRQKVNVKDLVLPNLSMADQISELERIIEGIRENVFDRDHISIIAQEVFGLQQVVTAAKNSQKVKLNALAQSLWDLRDQRLADAISLLKQHGAG